MQSDEKVIIGIDHAFSLPIEYYNRHKIENCWENLLYDFMINFPSHGNGVWVNHLRNKILKQKPPNEIRHLIGKRLGPEHEWSKEVRYRLTDKIAKSKSPFHFDAQGTVANSTFAGIPWLSYIRDNVPREKLHFWPFDGWQIPEATSAIVEVYPALWHGKKEYKDFKEIELKSNDERDAYCVAKWMAKTDLAGELDKYLKPELNDAEKKLAKLEGWILGVLPKTAIKADC